MSFTGEPDPTSPGHALGDELSANAGGTIAALTAAKVEEV
jgi:hypothetical protein